jgi:hypothetical protein
VEAYQESSACDDQPSQGNQYGECENHWVQNYSVGESLGSMLLSSLPGLSADNSSSSLFTRSTFMMHFVRFAGLTRWSFEQKHFKSLKQRSFIEWDE